MIPVTAVEHTSVISSEKIAHVIDFLTVCIGNLVGYRRALNFENWV